LGRVARDLTGTCAADHRRREVIRIIDPAAVASGASGVEIMNNFEPEYCLNMARRLDAAAAGMRDNSYLRKLLEEQAAKYRANAARG
jgi:hypothetical protein